MVAGGEEVVVGGEDILVGDKQVADDGADNPTAGEHGYVARRVARQHAGGQQLVGFLETYGHVFPGCIEIEINAFAVFPLHHGYEVVIRFFRVRWGCALHGPFPYHIPPGQPSDYAAA
jgi:hypothetical protein